MEKKNLNALLDRKLKENLKFNDYIDVLFDLAILIKYGYINKNDLIEKIFKKFNKIVDLEALLVCNKNIFPKIKYIIEVIKEMGDVNLPDIDSSIFDKEYSVLNFICQYEYKRAYCEENSDLIEHIINNMLDNIIFHEEENFDIIELLLLKKCSIDKKTKDYFNDYYLYRYIDTENINYLVKILLLKDNISRRIYYEIIKNKREGGFDVVSLLIIQNYIQYIDGKE